MKRVELAVESLLLASRWILVVFYLGLAVALAIYALTFGNKLVSFMTKALSMDSADSILAMLSFVSRFDAEDEVHWLGTIDSGSLKIKVASTIVAISSIDLLQIFLDIEKYTNDKIMWATLMHLAFVGSALVLAYVDRITNAGKAIKKGMDQ
jgi:uncharacterized membrane protein YqhA